MSPKSKHAQRRRLIVSFIGNTDVDYIDRRDDSPDQSPIYRLLRFLSLDPNGRAVKNALLLFIDPLRGDEKSERAQKRSRFVATLKEKLKGLGLGDMEIKPVELQIAGVTDRDGLYNEVWSKIPRSQEDAYDDYVFHLSSGALAMQTTLMLAATCMRFPSTPILYETWNKPGKEVERATLPYLLALRDSNRLYQKAGLKLDSGVKDALTKNEIIVDDPIAEHCYAELWRAATGKKAREKKGADTAPRTAPRVLITGPVGCGKRRAAEQFAAWRQEAIVGPTPGASHGAKHAWNRADDLAKPVQDGDTVLLPRIDQWSSREIHSLNAWMLNHPQVALVATWAETVEATWRPDRVMIDVLPGAMRVALPSLSTRDDISELAASLARQMSIPNCKLHEQFQHFFLEGAFPRNLHSLRTWIAKASANSSGIHPDQRGAQRAAESLDAEQALQTMRLAFEKLVALDFGPNEKLRDILQSIESAFLTRALVGRTQGEVGAKFGVAQSSVSKKKNTTRRPAKPKPQVAR